MRRSILLTLLLTSGCGVSLAQVADLGRRLADHADLCEIERKAGPSPTTPRCDAARRCLAAAETVIASESPARDQYNAAVTICGGKVVK